MLWECSDCGFEMAEYACLGYGSEVDNGCPKCGCLQIWFYILGYKDIPSTRNLVNVETDTILQRQIVTTEVTHTHTYKDY